MASISLLTVSVGAFAQGASPPSDSRPVDTVPQVPLTQDWSGREWLEAHGINLTGHIIVEPGINDKGYKGHGWTSAQSIDFGAIIDTGKLFGFDGSLIVVFSDRFGHAVHERYTGAYIQDQAYWGQGQNFRFDELSYERFFMDRRLSIKGGFYSMGNDFGGLPNVCNFNNNGQCGHPLGPIYSSGWLDNPTGQWGMRVKWKDPSGWYAQAGVYDVNPSRKQANGGFKLSFVGTTGALIPVEFGYVHGQSPRAYPGTYKVGFYLDTSDAPVLGAAGQTASHRTGEYVQLEQRFWKPSLDTVRGISAFAIATQADAATGLMRHSWEAGLSWRGTFPSREDDILSLAWTRLDISARTRQAEEAAGKAGQTNEQLYELNYGVQATHWLIVRPAVQYVIRPGAYTSRPDSFVFSLHLQATL
ncbi:carbohydrate porin [Dyella japonica]|nr:carbohydrate porin [Dyella japonica]